VGGDIVSPADAEWDLARRAWNLAVDQRPALVAVPADAADVVAIVDFARAHGLKVAPQGTGHNAAATASLEGTNLVSTQRMRGVEIDAEARTARVQAGTLWLEVTQAASPARPVPAVIDGAFAGGADAGARAVAALRALGPELDTWGMLPAVALSRLQMDHEEPDAVRRARDVAR
jgi:FAD/FMN-containing dehydrogenase